MKKMMIAAAAGVNISEDLIMEILSCLPPIIVLRFKSVSKTWYSLITNPVFFRRNTATQFDRRRQWCCINDDTLPPPHPPSILLNRDAFAGDSRILTFPPNGNDQSYYSYFYHKVSPLLLQKLIDYRPEHDYEKADTSFQVIDSCNGLLLYSSLAGYGIFPPTIKYNFYICNPITHDCIKLPTLEQEGREQRFTICNYSSPSIVFDPWVSLTYKVVIWLICIDHKTISSKNSEGEKHYRFYVYSSETRSWRLNQIKDPSIFDFVFLERGVLCNGVLYWITNYPCFNRYFSLRYDVEKDVISTLNLPKIPRYDVEKDVISTLNFPKIPPEYSKRILLYFGECGGRLRLIETYYKDIDVQLGMMHAFLSIFYVMELDNNDDSWTVKYRVNMGDDQVSYYANLVGEERYSKFAVHIMDIYKTKTKKAAGEQEIHQGDQEEEEELLLNIWNICIIPFNLSSNTFGKELRYGKKTLERDHDMGFKGVLRYNTITLFPVSSSS